MTKLLDEAIASVRTLPEPEQELAAQFLPAFCNPDSHRHRLDAEQAAEVELAQQEVREGKIASDAEMNDVWRRFGL